MCVLLLGFFIFRSVDQSYESRAENMIKPPRWVHLIKKISIINYKVSYELWTKIFPNWVLFFVVQRWRRFNFFVQIGSHTAKLELTQTRLKLPLLILTIIRVSDQGLPRRRSWVLEPKLGEAFRLKNSCKIFNSKQLHFEAGQTRKTQSNGFYKFLHRKSY